MHAHFVSRGCRAVAVALGFAVAGCGGGSGNGAPPDTTPDTFQFTDVADAESGQFYESSITIMGLGTGAVVAASLADISAPGHELFINGEKQDSHQGREVKNGDVVLVRLKAGEDVDGTVGATLTVSGSEEISDRFDVTTAIDIQKPQLAVHFPPPASLTDIPLPGVLKIRGHVSDGDAVASVTVNGSAVELDPATGDWVFEHDIVTTGQQVIAIEAADASGNVNAVAISLTHADAAAPADFGGGDDFGNPNGLAIDPAAGDLVYGDHTGMGRVDPATGDRTVFYSSSSGGFDGNFTDVARPSGEGPLYGISWRDDVGVGRIDRATGTGTPVSIRGDGHGADEGYDSPGSLALDDAADRAFVLDADSSFIWRIDLESGARERVPGEFPGGEAVDFDLHSGLVLLAACKLETVHPDSGERQTLFLETEDFCADEIDVNPDAVEAAITHGFIDRRCMNVLNLVDDTLMAVPGCDADAFGPHQGDPDGFDVDWEHRVAYVLDDSGVADGDYLMAVDLVTGYRVIMSRER